MTYAIGKNKITCAEPGSKFIDSDGKEVIVAGCSQPGSESVKQGGVELEYCERHAYLIWKEEDAKTGV